MSRSLTDDDRMRLMSASEVSDLRSSDNRVTSSSVGGPSARLEFSELALRKLDLFFDGCPAAL